MGRALSRVAVLQQHTRSPTCTVPAAPVDAARAAASSSCSSLCRSETVERKCDKCGRVTPMLSRPWLTSLPPVLVVALKRFEFSPETCAMTKISQVGGCTAARCRGRRGRRGPTRASGLRRPFAALPVVPCSRHRRRLRWPRHTIITDRPASPAAPSAAAAQPVAFPLAGLDLAPYVLDYDARAMGPSLYSLLSVVLHVGPSPERGHYTAYARHLRGPAFFYFDDATSVRVPDSDVTSPRAAALVYLLFYVRADLAATEEEGAAAAAAAAVTPATGASGVEGGDGGLAGGSDTEPGSEAEQA
jgi:hypothetical protein